MDNNYSLVKVGLGGEISGVQVVAAVPRTDEIYKENICVNGPAYKYIKQLQQEVSNLNSEINFLMGLNTETEALKQHEQFLREIPTYKAMPFDIIVDAHGKKRLVGREWITG